MIFFNSKKPEPEAIEASDVEIIRAKMTACDAAIREAETELHRVSLTAALSEDDSAQAKEAIAKLNELRSRKAILDAALTSAIQAERENAGRLSAAEHKTRQRALSQHLGRLQRDAADVTAALVSLRDGYRSMVESAESALRVLPQSMLSTDTAWESLLSPKQLRLNCELEAWRLTKDGPAFPACAVNRPMYAHDLPPLEQIIRELAGNLRASLEKCGPVTAKPIAHDTPAPDYTIDLRGQNLGVPKTPTEPEEMTANA